MRMLRTAILTVAGGLLTVSAGLLIAVVLLTLTSPPDRGRVVCPVSCVATQAGRTDFWTGEITPMILSQYDGALQVTNVRVVPEDYKDYRVIPLPIGFAVGSLLTLTVIAIAARRPRRTVPNPPVPAT
jgi:hypothetical protein